MDNIQERLKTLFYQLFPILNESDEYDINTISLDDFPDWDSIAQMNLLNMLEEEFRIQIPDEVAIELKTFSAVEDYLSTKS